MSSYLPFPIIISLYVLVTDTQKKLKAQDINLYLNITNRLIKKQDSTVGSISDRPQYSVDRKRVCDSGGRGLVKIRIGEKFPSYR